MNRWQIYKLIDEEREHQDEMYGETNALSSSTFDSLNDTAQWLIYMESYLNRAKSKFMGNAGVPKKLHRENPLHAHVEHEKAVLKDIIKVAALAVACLEHRGYVFQINEGEEDMWHVKRK